MDAPRKIEFDIISGSLTIDYTRNTVHFVPDHGGSFQLPLAPLDVDIARSLTYAKTKPEERA